MTKRGEHPVESRVMQEATALRRALRRKSRMLGWLYVLSHSSLAMMFIAVALMFLRNPQRPLTMVFPILAAFAALALGVVPRFVTRAIAARTRAELTARLSASGLSDADLGDELDDFESRVRMMTTAGPASIP
jgi:hypothetical protein